MALAMIPAIWRQKALTPNTYRITEEYNEPTRRAIFYVWDNTRILGAYQTQLEAEKFINKSANELTMPRD
jgi:hypothetical protein